MNNINNKKVFYAHKNIVRIKKLTACTGCSTVLAWGQEGDYPLMLPRLLKQSVLNKKKFQ